MSGEGRRRKLAEAFNDVKQRLRAAVPLPVGHEAPLILCHRSEGPKNHGLDKNVPPPRESKLAQATRHVIEGKRIVARQRERVAWLKARGMDSSRAEQLLDQFEHTLAIFEVDLQAIQAKENSK